MKEGIEQGILQEKKQLSGKLLAMGMSLNEIANLCGLKIEDIKKLK